MFDSTTGLLGWSLNFRIIGLVWFVLYWFNAFDPVPVYPFWVAHRLCLSFQQVHVTWYDYDHRIINDWLGIILICILKIIIFLLLYKKFISSKIFWTKIVYRIVDNIPLSIILNWWLLMIIIQFQGLAILLSCILYGHTVTTVGIFGIIIVFVAVFLRIYCNHRLKAIRRHQITNNKSWYN